MTYEPMGRRRTCLRLVPAALLGLGALPGLTATAPLQEQATGLGVSHRVLRFPADFGSHPDTALEWWYLTGWLADVAQAAPVSTGAEQQMPPQWGFQLTFFRSRTGVPEPHPSRFATHQLILAHVALSDLRDGKLLHEQRIARAYEGLTGSALGDTAVQLRDWRLQRETVAATPASPAPAGSLYRISVPHTDAGFALELDLRTTQPVLLQGEAGWSRKGPQPAQASHYYSEPQMAVQGRLQRGSDSHTVQGRGWLDHEWSNALLDADAVGWDWIGINLFNGSALTAFRLRRRDGSALWHGGSWREPGGTPLAFAPDTVQFTPQAMWTSRTSGGHYPTQWRVQTPAGRWEVRALLDAQELGDSRAATGTVYWEGLSELLDAAGRRVGLGYLEMTGYVGRLVL